MLQIVGRDSLKLPLKGANNGWSTLRNQKTSQNSVHPNGVHLPPPVRPLLLPLSVYILKRTQDDWIEWLFMNQDLLCWLREAECGRKCENYAIDS